MKKLLALLLIGAPVAGLAQSGADFESKGNTEIYVGYGLLTAPDLITGFSNLFTGALLPGMVEKIDSKGFGSAFGGIDYYLGNRFTLGIQYAYASFERRYEMDDESIATLKNQYHTLMLRGKGVWVAKPVFQLYSALAAGPSFARAKNNKGETKSNTEFAFQVSPIGIRVGNHIAFFLEGGFGYQGMLSGGLSARF